MSYKDKFGGTIIRKSKYDNLQISWDVEEMKDIEYPTKRFPVLLFTPDMDNTDEHYHIHLGLREAKILQKWLTDYLMDRAAPKRKSKNQKRK